MRRLEIEPGEIYGDLEVVSERFSDVRRSFVCRCSCGRHKTVRLDHLRSGHTSSCGRCGVEYKGKRQTIRDWAKEYGINESTLRARLQTMDIGEALERG